MVLSMAFSLIISLAMREAPNEDDTYRFPMSGSDFLLAGTFGELRSNHFHSGIDIKTGGSVGKPLFAVRDGYVYRIKSSAYGFGKAVYLRHADGEFSVYGHMDGFNPAIQAYLYQKQYASKQFEQELYLAEDEMPVKKGDLIGYSGNSGSSHGPHLHFEIRDPQEEIMNPLHYYRAMVQDHKKPEVVGIAFEPLSPSSRVADKFEKLVIKPSGNPGSYQIAEVIKLKGKVGLEYDAFDQLDGAPNHCGINYAKVYLDGRQIFEFNLDQFSFDNKRYINVHFDYTYNKNGGRKYERAYVEPGNQLPCYSNLENDGFIDLKDDLIHSLRLELADGYRNTTTVNMRVQRSFGAPLPTNLSGSGSSIKYEIKRNILSLHLTKPGNAALKNGIELRFPDGKTESLLPAYFDGSDLVFLYNFDKWRLPESVVDPSSGARANLNLKQTIMPNKDNIVEQAELQAFFPFGAVFDSLQLPLKVLNRIGQAYSDRYEIGDEAVPLFKSFVISIKPQLKGNLQHMVIAKKGSGGKWEFLGNDKKDDGSIYASSSNFGTFCVMADSTEPIIKPLNITDAGVVSSKQNALRLQLSDNFSGINSQKIHCAIDGNWELFEFDGKTSTISHEIKNRVSGSKHVLEVMVYDNANNMAKSVFNLTY